MCGESMEQEPRQGYFYRNQAFSQRQTFNSHHTTHVLKGIHVANRYANTFLRAKGM